MNKLKSSVWIWFFQIPNTNCIHRLSNEVMNYWIPASWSSWVALSVEKPVTLSTKWSLNLLPKMAHWLKNLSNSLEQVVCMFSIRNSIIFSTYLCFVIADRLYVHASSSDEINKYLHNRTTIHTWWISEQSIQIQCLQKLQDKERVAFSSIINKFS